MQMLGMGNNGLLLMGIQIHTATMEIGVQVA